MTLDISLTRWGHDLKLIQADGKEFPLEPAPAPGSSELSSADVAGDPPYYFTYLTSHRQTVTGVDWRVHDGATGEDSPVNPTDSDLAQWAWLISPVHPAAIQIGQNDIVVTWRMSSVLRRFSLDGEPLPAISAGGFRIERQEGMWNWHTVAVVPAPDAQTGGGVFQFRDSVDTWAGGHWDWEVYQYRISYFYGSQSTAPVETNSGNLGNSSNSGDTSGADSDGDGYSDDEENRAGTDPNNSDSHPDYPPLSAGIMDEWVLASSSTVFQLGATGGDGSPITYKIDGFAIRGTLEGVTSEGDVPDGQMVYNAPSFAYCVDTIDYTVMQNGVEKKGHLIIHVMPNDSDALSAENQEVSTPFETPVDIYLDATNGVPPYNFQITSWPEHGTLFADYAWEGYLYYTPDDGFIGDDTIGFTAYDEAYSPNDINGDNNDHTANAGVTIHVTPPPLTMEWKAIQGWYNVDDNRSMVDFNYFQGVAPPDDRWLPGRGRRIFPDKKNMNDAIRNKAVLQIHTTPKAPGIKVYLKAFDVDDATPEDFDSDSNTQDPVIDTNGRKGNDNKDNDPTRLKTGQFIVGGVKAGERAVTLDPNGDARVIFETTMQPGDNFRVALAFKPEDLIPLQVDDPDGSGFVDGNSEQQPNGFVGLVSPMLTVWRKLNIEVDSMDVVPSPRGVPDEINWAGRHKRR